MARRMLAAAATAAALTSVVPAAPASAQLCEMVEDCVCRLLVNCTPPISPRCYEVWGAIVCVP